MIMAGGLSSAFSTAAAISWSDAVTTRCSGFVPQVTIPTGVSGGKFFSFISLLLICERFFMPMRKANVFSGLYSGKFTSSVSSASERLCPLITSKALEKSL